jgi:hypothetical protein
LIILPICLALATGSGIESPSSFETTNMDFADQSSF